jgi:hypothetical protein
MYVFGIMLKYLIELELEGIEFLIMMKDHFIWLEMIELDIGRWIVLLCIFA